MRLAFFVERDVLVSGLGCVFFLLRGSIVPTLAAESAGVGVYLGVGVGGFDFDHVVGSAGARAFSSGICLGVFSVVSIGSLRLLCDA